MIATVVAAVADISPQDAHREIVTALPDICILVLVAICTLVYLMRVVYPCYRYISEKENFSQESSFKLAQ